jgi:hypothetical protein
MSYAPSDVFNTMNNEKPNKHMYFNDDGDEISHEEFLRNHEQQQQEQHQEPCWAIKTPRINFRFTIADPLVLLQFLRFIDYYNENALPDEVYMLKPMSYTQYKNLMDSDFMKNTPREFEEEAYELRDRLGNHLDLSELQSV